MLGRLSIALMLASAAPAARAEVRARFAFALADGTGTLPMSWPSLSWDARFDELYVVDHREGLIGIFSDSGMRVHSFGDEASLGAVYGVAPLASGELLVLSLVAGNWMVTRCNFRGEPLQPLRITGASAKFLDGFNPTSIFAVKGRLYLADQATLRVLVTDESGAAITAHELLAAVQPDARKRDGIEARGFAVDGAGNILFTVTSLFRAFVVAPDGAMRSFGTRGSSPGKFNIVAGIAADENGRLYLTDTLRAVVMVFEPDGRFLGEFGYRGEAADNLIAPADIAAGGGRVFVAQSVGGVKVFEVVVN